MDILTEECLRKVLSTHPEQIENVLHCDKIVKQLDGSISDILLTHPIAASLLVHAYYVSDLTSHERQLYIPSGLTLEQKEKIIDQYLDGPNTKLGTVRIVMQSKDTDSLKINPKIRLKARRLESELAKIPEDAIVSSIQTGFSIEYVNDSTLPPKQEKLEDLFFSFVYNEHYLDRLDDTQLMNAFFSLFGYLDKNGLLTLCNNRNEDDFLEKIDTTEIKGLYRMNSWFRMKNNIAVSQLALFDAYLRRRGKSLEFLIKAYFESHFKDDYGFPGLSLNMPNDVDTYANKNKVIAPEMEAVVNQFNLYVEEGDVDPELYESRMPLPISLAKSLLYGKHKYVVIAPTPNEIYNPLYFIFSDQSMLSYVDPYKDKLYHTLFNLLVNDGSVEYSNYEEYQRPRIDYLIQNGYLKNENGLLSFGNIPRIRALKLLYDRREISYYHCEPDVRAEIDKMVADGWLKYDEYLLSPEERHYLNFFLNNSEYSNGMQLRNKYSHGRSSCTQSDADHKNAYYYFLMMFVIILLKIDEDMRMSIYLNGQVDE